MARIFILANDIRNGCASAILDLDRLPVDVTNTTVTAWCDQAMKAAAWFVSDPTRAVTVTRELATHTLGREAKHFLGELASFVENCPPSSQGMEDWLLFCDGEDGELMRVRQTDAERIFLAMRSGVLPLQSWCD
jgi:hypothetical protein